MATPQTSTLEQRKQLAERLPLPSILEIGPSRTKPKRNVQKAIKKLIAEVQADESLVCDHAGSSRLVFTSAESNAVYKIPYSAYDVKLSQMEVWYYEQDAFGYPVVPCRLIWTKTGVPVVVMEKVTVQGDSWNKPAWGSYVDHGQIARSELLEGTWAAYDAGWPTTNKLSFLGIETFLRGEYKRLARKNRSLAQSRFRLFA